MARSIALSGAVGATELFDGCATAAANDCHFLAPSLPNTGFATNSSTALYAVYADDDDDDSLEDVLILVLCFNFDADMVATLFFGSHKIQNTHT